MDSQISPAAESDMDVQPETGQPPVEFGQADVPLDGEPPDALPPPEKAPVVALPEAKAAALPEGVSGALLFGPVEGADSLVRAEDPTVTSYHRSFHTGFHRMVLRYSRQVVACPLSLMLIVTIPVAILIAARFKIPEVEFDFSTFIRADGDAMLRREAYLLAFGERKGPNARRRLLEGDSMQDLSREIEEVLSEQAAHANDETSVRRLYGSLIWSQGITILYDAPISVFDKKVMQAIRDFEVRMRSLASWQTMCGEMVASSLTYLCDPGESFVAFAWASQVPPSDSDGAATRFVMRQDGLSSEPIPVPAVLALVDAEGHQLFDLSRFFPTTFTVPQRNGTGAEAGGALPQQMRSRFWFSFDVTASTQSEIRAKVDASRAAWTSFVRDELYPILQEGISGEGLKVRYSGDSLTSLELISTLQSDLLFAIGSVLVVLLCLWFQLQAVWMSVVSLFVILLSLPIAYVLTPAEKLTVTSFLALFLVVGIGSDTVFVFGDFWEQERHRKLDERVAVVLIEAGKNCFATSLTTAASFLANMASVLQPLREFGFFMGLCVLSVFVLIVAYLPPMLVIQSRRRQAKEDARSAAGAREVHPASMSAIVPAGAIEPKAPSHQVVSEETGCPRLVRSYLRALAIRVAFCPGVVAVFTVLLIGLFAVGISLDIRLATGVPQLFPPGHNQVELPLVEEKFSAIPKVDVETSVAPNPLRTACNIDVAPSSGEVCSLYWCDQVDELGYGGSSSSADGSCWASPVRLTDGTGSLADCSVVNLQVKAAALTRPSTTGANSVLGSMASALTGSRYSSATTAADTRELATLVAESWSTGNVVTSRFFRLGTARISLAAAPGATQACTAQAVCFWDVPRCDLEGFQSLGNHTPSRRLESAEEHESLQEQEEVWLPAELPGRRLQVTQTVPTNKQIDVTILWGVRAPRTTPLLGPNAEQWSFDPTFEMGNPWAQRAIISMCQDELPEDLRILRRRCWIQDFKRKLSNLDRRFPSRSFHSEIVPLSVGELDIQDQLWMVDGSVRAAMLNFHVDVAFDIGAANIMEYKAHWDRFIDTGNAEASDTANRAWHTAQAWVLAEAELAIINSTIITIVVAALCGFGCMLLFTNDPTLAMLVLLLVMGVVTGLAFFMVVIMAWALGPIEVIALVVFVGYSVTYSLHVAHIFGEVDGVDDEANLKAEEDEGVLAPDLPAIGPPDASGADQAASSSKEPRGSLEVQVAAPAEEDPDGQAARMVRVRKALLRIGLSTLSSTLSTVGASAFLLSATMQVFTKLGSVVIAVSVLSCVASLVILPALLVLFGPGRTPWYIRCFGCCCRGRANRAGSQQVNFGGRETDLDYAGRGNEQLPVATGRTVH